MKASVVKLYRKYQEGTTTPDEREKVLTFIREGRYLEEWDTALTELSDELLETPQATYLDADTTEALRKRILHSARPQRPIRIPIPITGRQKWFYAASVAVVLAVFAMINYPKWQAWFGKDRAYQSVDLEMVQPGNNKAVLTLPDGQVIDLDKVQGGLVMKDAIQYADGRPILDGATLDALSDMDGAEMEISTPRGGTYQVILPDGSRVLLNAASSLRYPIRFTKSAREVTISGEAYFEVITDPSKPFRVRSGRQSVEVLGTKFNIAAYPEDGTVQTTLATGKIHVHTDTEEVMLEPGQQSTMDGGIIQVREVDPGIHLAWTEGRFNFEGKSFGQVMDELGRWYDFETLYEGSIPDVEFLGGAYRTDRISSVLRILSGAGVQYQMVQEEGGGHKLIITGES